MFGEVGVPVALFALWWPEWQVQCLFLKDIQLHKQRRLLPWVGLCSPCEGL